MDRIELKNAIKEQTEKNRELNAKLREAKKDIKAIKKEKIAVREEKEKLKKEFKTTYGRGPRKKEQNASEPTPSTTATAPQATPEASSQ